LKGRILTLAVGPGALFRFSHPREREVMALVVSGLLNKQVGGELGISEIIVSRH
jgi:FixJ family two-component response regulator